MSLDVAKISERGTLVIPVLLRQRFGLEEGALVIAEDHGDGILIKRAVALPAEHYSAERKAEFLLSNAISDQDYVEAQKAVREMGLDPDKIVHYRQKHKS